MRLRFQKLLAANSLDEMPKGVSRGIDLGSLRAGGASWLLMVSEDSELTRRRGRWITAKVMEIYVQEAWAIQFMPRLPQKTKDKISKGIAIFDWILEQCVGWRQAAIPDAAWPVLAFEAAKALELNEMGQAGSDELKKLGGEGATFGQMARVHPPSSMEKQVREKLLCNFECAVDGSKPPAAPSLAA